MEAEERQGQTTYGTIGFRSGTRLGGRIADLNNSLGDLPRYNQSVLSQRLPIKREISLLAHADCSWHIQQMISNAFTMAGASYLPWMAGALTERPGRGYWLAFNQRLPISYKTGDCIIRLLYLSHLVRDEEDAEGEIAEDAIEEEAI